MTNDYNGGKTKKMLLNAKYGKVCTTVDFASKIWDCFDFDCDACVKENCKGCPLNIEEAN